MQFDRLKRREFITLLGGAAAGWPLAARAQQSKMARIGALYIGTADAESFKKELREGLRELGYVEGQNIAFEFRSAEGNTDRLPALAAELVRLKVDVIVALYVPSALAAKQATKDIPIVTIAAEPVESDLVAGLARWRPTTHLGICGKVLISTRRRVLTHHRRCRVKAQSAFLHHNIPSRLGEDVDQRARQRTTNGKSESRPC
jgi:hypothetical protein